ncbi:MAG: hypothetical protein IJY13_02130 [Clostridia bacterium]|nr:hypothetical protein [Clostridia bacterium]
MKNKNKRIIKYTGLHRLIIFTIILVALGVLFVIPIVAENASVLIIPGILLCICLPSIIIYGNRKIVFDYDNQVITAFCVDYGMVKKTKVAMSDVKRIQFVECDYLEKGKSKFWGERRGWWIINNNPFHVYNSGKVYWLKITKTNDDVEVITYPCLYDCKSPKVVEEFEKQVNQLIDEFNSFRYPKKSNKKHK